ncbi:hypothetical protein CCACVL1_22422, partial [Corchorus capsularis]
ALQASPFLNGANVRGQYVTPSLFSLADPKIPKPKYK